MWGQRYKDCTPKHLAAGVFSSRELVPVCCACALWTSHCLSTVGSCCVMFGAYLWTIETFSDLMCGWCGMECIAPGYSLPSRRYCTATTSPKRITVALWSQPCSASEHSKLCIPTNTWMRCNIGWDLVSGIGDRIHVTVSTSRYGL